MVVSKSSRMLSCELKSSNDTCADCGVMFTTYEPVVLKTSLRPSFMGSGRTPSEPKKYGLSTRTRSWPGSTVMVSMNRNRVMKKPMSPSRTAPGPSTGRMEVCFCCVMMFSVVVGCTSPPVRAVGEFGVLLLENGLGLLELIHRDHVGREVRVQHALETGFGGAANLDAFDRGQSGQKQFSGLRFSDVQMHHSSLLTYIEITAQSS